MKALKRYIILSFAVLMLDACDDDFVDVNTNPYSVVEIDPSLLFARSLRSHLGGYGSEHTIVQQYVNPYNQGATLGFNFNADIDNRSNGKWEDAYRIVIRNLVHAENLLSENPELTNLLSMIQIWKANIFMGLVDTYGNVPYSEAGKGVINGTYFPAYDDDESIYAALYDDLTAAIDRLDPNADYVGADLFYGDNSESPAGSNAVQVEHWLKLGNSILLRLGMRYSKSDPSRAEAIVSEAFSGGVMTSNDDNAYVKNDGILYLQEENNNLRDFSFHNYAAEPFVDQLKATNDPRGQYILATYADPGAVANDASPDTDLSNQFGIPIGISDAELSDTNLGYRGTRGAGLNYAQFNIYAAAAPDAPDFYMTYAQTSLLLAEAAYRGWITGDPQLFYENAIRADLENYQLYPNTTAFTSDEINDYLAEPLIAYNSANALNLINTQYWVVSIRNGSEAWANFRRSGFPDLSRNDFNDDLLANGGDGFVHRMSYPDREGSANPESYATASEAMGGDNLISRVFWDVP